MEKPNHGLIALYRVAQGTYKMRTYATTSREYDVNQVLAAKRPEFKLDELFQKHKK
jgi:hypothetical protein